MRIGDLKKLIAEWEARHTAEDDKYIGKFDDQHIIVPVFEWNKPYPYDPAGAWDFKGYSREVNVYWDVTGLGLVIEDKPKMKEENNADT